MRTRWVAIGAAIAITLGSGGGLALVNAADNPPSAFIPVTPTRALDTRTNLGLAGPFSSPTTRTLQLTGTINTPNGPTQLIPPGATAVVLNTTAVNPTNDGFISIQPGGTPGPRRHHPQRRHRRTAAKRHHRHHLRRLRPNRTHHRHPHRHHLNSSNVTRINPATGTATNVSLPAGANNPADIVFDGVDIWTANASTDNVSRINLATSAATNVALPAGASQPRSLAFDGTYVWTANSNNVTRISPPTEATVNVALPAGTGG